jgi:type IV secretion system T-DNA border endonuclease VirD2
MVMTMSRRLNAVDKVIGKLFDGPRKKEQGGGPGQPRSNPKSRGKAGSSSGGFATNRMSRVGGRHGQAIFKLVTKGGTNDRSGLKGQLNYIFRDDKAARIIDPSGRIESNELVTNKQLNEITLAWSNDWWKGTRNGQTSHMILSFPRDVSIDDVTEITRDVCNEKFNTGDARFEYVVAVHDDQEHHPHAHIVVNRRASDNSLFQMRPGTENSYEGFRESMAAHAERRGIFLDPTSRFERGITDRQPTRTEQVAAQKEGRPPQQRPRTGADLEYAKEQISFAKIGYEAMAVVAINADCQRLERAYLDVADTIETNGGNFQMQNLSADELEKFDQYASLLNEAIAKTEGMLAAKSAAARVPLEIRLNNTMEEFTAISPNSQYAKSLHEQPSSNSIYMHEFAGNDAAWTRAQGRLTEISQETGLDAEALAARLEAGAPNRYVEQMWMRDDLQRLAKVTDLNLNDPTERTQAIEDVSRAYQEVREELVSAHVLRPVPQFEDDYYDANGDRQVTQAERSSMEDQFQRTDFGYFLLGDEHEKERFDAGAEGMRDLEQVFTDFAERSPEHAALVSELWDRENMISKPEGYLEPADRPNDSVSNERDPDEPQLEKAMEQFTIFAAQSRAHASFASQHWDETTKSDRVPVGYLPEEERERLHDPAAPGNAKPDPFAEWAARSPGEYSITKTAADHQEVLKLLKENTTDAQYSKFRQGDLSGIEHITTDPVFARQLLAEVDSENKSKGYELTRTQELGMADSRDFVRNAIEDDNDRDHGHER